MGCDIYTIEAQNNGGWTDVGIRFSDSDDTVGCLCTFANNMKNQRFDIRDVRDLAILGAAVALVHDGHFRDSYFDTSLSKWYYYLPSDLPEWVRDGIDHALGSKHAEVPS